MATWSGIRKKLETEYLAQSLRGHFQYYATTYSKSPDHVGRAAIRYDRKELIKGCYWNGWMKADLFPKDEKWEFSTSVVFIGHLRNLTIKALMTT